MFVPQNELGVVSIFSVNSLAFGYELLEMQAAFPDAILRETVSGRVLRCEIEYESANFKKHGHDPSGCDIIVCWKHNWTDAPVPVVCLEKMYSNGHYREMIDVLSAYLGNIRYASSAKVFTCPNCKIPLIPHVRSKNELSLDCKACNHIETYPYSPVNKQAKCRKQGIYKFYNSADVQLPERNIEQLWSQT